VFQNLDGSGRIDVSASKHIGHVATMLRVRVYGRMALGQNDRHGNALRLKLMAVATQNGRSSLLASALQQGLQAAWIIEQGGICALAVDNGVSSEQSTGPPVYSTG